MAQRETRTALALGPISLDANTVDLRMIDPEKDYRVPIDMTIQSIGYALDELQTYLDRNGREAEYLELTDNQARLNSQLTRLILVCSVLRERSRRQALQAAE